MTERLVGKEHSQPKYFSLGQMAREFIRENFCGLIDLNSRMSTYRAIKHGDYSGVVVGLGMILKSKEHKLLRAENVRKIKLSTDLIYLQHLKETIVKYRDPLKQKRDLTVDDFERPQNDKWVDFETNPIFYLNFLRKVGKSNVTYGSGVNTWSSD